jgi:hypothetical protein
MALTLAFTRRRVLQIVYKLFYETVLSFSGNLLADSRDIACQIAGCDL